MRKEDVIESINDSILYYEDRIKAWEKVEIVTKKDGGCFKNLSKNFTNANLLIKDRWDGSPHIEIYVSFQSKKGGWKNDTIYVDSHDVNDIRKAIKKTLYTYNVYMERAKNNLCVVGDYMERIEPLIIEINKILMESEKVDHPMYTGDNNGLHYDLIEWIKYNIRTKGSIL